MSAPAAAALARRLADDLEAARVPYAPDLERLVAFLGDTFDDAYVRRWLVDLVGSGDERARRWDWLVAEVRA